MTTGSIASLLGLGAGALLAGFGFGLVYFRVLRRTIALFTAGAGWRMPLALTLARGLGAALVLTGLAQLGAAALLAGFAGFLFARRLALHADQRA